jgi:hypothetical protein
MRSRFSAKAAPSPLCPPPTMTTSWTWPSRWKRGASQSAPPILSVARSCASRAARSARLMPSRPAAVARSRRSGERGRDSLSRSLPRRFSIARIMPALSVRRTQMMNGKVERRAIGRIERVEAIELPLRQPVEPGEACSAARRRSASGRSPPCPPVRGARGSAQAVRRAWHHTTACISRREDRPIGQRGGAFDHPGLCSNKSR